MPPSIDAPAFHMPVITPPVDADDDAAEYYSNLAVEFSVAESGAVTIDISDVELSTIYAMCTGLVRYIPAGEAMPTAEPEVAPEGGALHLKVGPNGFFQLRNGLPDGLSPMHSILYVGVDFNSVREAVRQMLQLHLGDWALYDWPFLVPPSLDARTIIDAFMASRVGMPVWAGVPLGQAAQTAGGGDEGRRLILRTLGAEGVELPPVQRLRAMPTIAGAQWKDHPLATELAEFDDFAKLLSYLKVKEAEFLEHADRYFERLGELLARAGVDIGSGLNRETFANAVRRFQGEQGYPVDGTPGQNTLWELHTGRFNGQDSWVKENSFEEVECPADVWVPEGVDYNWEEHGLNYFRFRPEAAEDYNKLRAEAMEARILITSAGSLRRLDEKVTESRSPVSLHYTGTAFDLSTTTGMGKGDIDTEPYLVEQEEEGGRTRWRVWARVDVKPYGAAGDDSNVGEHQVRKIDAVVWDTSEEDNTRTQTITATVVDFTALAASRGFERIGPRSNWPTRYLNAEWWHFEYRSALVPWISQFGAELLRLHREAAVRAQSHLWNERLRIYRRNKNGWR